MHSILEMYLLSKSKEFRFYKPNIFILNDVNSLFNLLESIDHLESIQEIHGGDKKDILEVESNTFVNRTDE